MTTLITAPARTESEIPMITPVDIIFGGGTVGAGPTGKDMIIELGQKSTNVALLILATVDGQMSTSCEKRYVRFDPIRANHPQVATRP